MSNPSTKRKKSKPTSKNVATAVASPEGGVIISSKLKSLSDIIQINSSANGSGDLRETDFPTSDLGSSSGNAASTSTRLPLESFMMSTVPKSPSLRRVASQTKNGLISPPKNTSQETSSALLALASGMLTPRATAVQEDILINSLRDELQNEGSLPISKHKVEEGQTSLRVPVQSGSDESFVLSSPPISKLSASEIENRFRELMEGAMTHSDRGVRSSALEPSSSLSIEENMRGKDIEAKSIVTSSNISRSLANSTTRFIALSPDQADSPDNIRKTPKDSSRYEDNAELSNSLVLSPDLSTVLSSSVAPDTVQSTMSSFSHMSFSPDGGSSAVKDLNETIANASLDDDEITEVRKIAPDIKSPVVLKPVPPINSPSLTSKPPAKMPSVNPSGSDPDITNSLPDTVTSNTVSPPSSNEIHSSLASVVKDSQDISNLRSELLLLRSELSRETQAKLQLQRRVDALVTTHLLEKEELQASLKRAQEWAETERQQREAESKELQQESERADQAISELSTTKSRSANLEVRLKSLETMNSALEQQNKELQRFKEEQELEKQAQGARLTQLEASKRSLEATITHLESRLSDAVKVGSEAELLRSQLMESERKVIHLEKQLLAAVHEPKLVGDVSSQQDGLRASQAPVTSSSPQKAPLGGETEFHKSLSESLRREHSQLLARHAELQRRCESLEQQLEEQRASLNASSSSRIEELERLLQEAEKRFAGEVAAHAASRSRLLQLTVDNSSLQDVSRARDEAVSILDRAEEINEEALDKIAALEAEIVALQDELQTLRPSQRDLDDATVGFVTLGLEFVQLVSSNGAIIGERPHSRNDSSDEDEENEKEEEHGRSLEPDPFSPRYGGGRLPNSQSSPLEFLKFFINVLPPFLRSRALLQRELLAARDALGRSEASIRAADARIAERDSRLSRLVDALSALQRRAREQADEMRRGAAELQRARAERDEALQLRQLAEAAAARAEEEAAVSRFTIDALTNELASIQRSDVTSTSRGSISNGGTTAHPAAAGNAGLAGTPLPLFVQGLLSAAPSSDTLRRIVSPRSSSPKVLAPSGVVPPPSFTSTGRTLPTAPLRPSPPGSRRSSRPSSPSPPSSPPSPSPKRPSPPGSVASAAVPAPPKARPPSSPSAKPKVVPPSAPTVSNTKDKDKGKKLPSPPSSPTATRPRAKSPSPPPKLPDTGANPKALRPVPPNATAKTTATSSKPSSSVTKRAPSPPGGKPPTRPDSPSSTTTKKAVPRPPPPSAATVKAKGNDNKVSQKIGNLSPKSPASAASKSAESVLLVPGGLPKKVPSPPRRPANGSIKAVAGEKEKLIGDANSFTPISNDIASEEKQNPSLEEEKGSELRFIQKSASESNPELSLRREIAKLYNLDFDELVATSTPSERLKDTVPPPSHTVQDALSNTKAILTRFVSGIPMLSPPPPPKSRQVILPVASHSTSSTGAERSLSPAERVRKTLGSLGFTSTSSSSNSSPRALSSLGGNLDNADNKVALTDAGEPTKPYVPPMTSTYTAPPPHVRPQVIAAFSLPSKTNMAPSTLSSGYGPNASISAPIGNAEPASYASEANTNSGMIADNQFHHTPSTPNSLEEPKYTYSPRSGIYSPSIIAEATPSLSYILDPQDTVRSSEFSAGGRLSMPLLNKDGSRNWMDASAGSVNYHTLNVNYRGTEAPRGVPLADVERQVHAVVKNNMRIPVTIPSGDVSHSSPFESESSTLTEPPFLTNGLIDLNFEGPEVNPFEQMENLVGIDAEDQGKDEVRGATGENIESTAHSLSLLETVGDENDRKHSSNLPPPPHLRNLSASSSAYAVASPVLSVPSVTVDHPKPDNISISMKRVSTRGMRKL